MADLEKLTINLTPVDVGQIELLVDQGFYANRAELIRVAIRDQLAKHGDVVRETAARQSMVVGAAVYDRGTLEKLRDTGQRISLRVVGLLVVQDDVPAALAEATIESVTVHGVFKASASVKQALADRIKR